MKQLQQPSRRGGSRDGSIEAPERRRGWAGDRQTYRFRRAENLAVGAAAQFTDLVTRLDRCARREHRTLPTPAERGAVHAVFWNQLIPTLERVDQELDPSRLAQARRAVQAVVNPWMLRSRLWARSWLKPHGYPGDYRMLEWMYDLELDPCADPYQPAAVNLLDGLYKSVHSVQAVWHRREWFADEIAEHVRASQRPVRVLDVACGGSRYVRDVIERHGPARVEGTFVDQDPAALAFLGSRLPEPAKRAATVICAPVSQVAESLAAPVNGQAGGFDVVISTGLFDYLPQETARALLGDMTALTRPGGTVAICNFGPDDRSKAVKDWIADWPLTYRNPDELGELFPEGKSVSFNCSPDGGLNYARATKRRA